MNPNYTYRLKFAQGFLQEVRQDLTIHQALFWAEESLALSQHIFAHLTTTRGEHD